MKSLTVVGIDLAKNVFELVGVDSHGKPLFRKRLKRSEMSAFFANIPACRVVMEACGGAHYWGRLFTSQGHRAQLIAAQYVKPFKLGQKNDRNDAQAIVEAALRPQMRYVAVKPLPAQDLQSLHRVRQQLISTRVMLVNQIRGLLMEYGVVLEESFSKFREQIADVLEDANNELTPLIRDLIIEQNDLLNKVTTKEQVLELKLKTLVSENTDCQRLMQVPGVGINSASLFIASLAKPDNFKNGRHVAAWLGLVPKQSSSGETTRLGRITKAGDGDLRMMLVHGARAAILSAIRKQKTDPHSQWMLRLQKEKGWNKAVVAVANKNARIMYRIFKNKVDYKAS